jgi:hypothetical protein
VGGVYIKALADERLAVKWRGKGMGSNPAYLFNKREAK